MRPFALVLMISAASLGASIRGNAQSVPARLALFEDPSAITTTGNLVLGRTSLREAQQLFPDAPKHQGPLPYVGNPQYMQHEPTLDLEGASVDLRYSFFPGKGRAVLVFDQHERLVSIEQARFAYSDPDSGKPVVEMEPWDSAAVSRRDFREHYPATKGLWFDPVHYRIQGMIGECLAVTAWFYQAAGEDRLASLAYHYTCPTRAKSHAGR